MKNRYESCIFHFLCNFQFVCLVVDIPNDFPLSSALHAQWLAVLFRRKKFNVCIYQVADLILRVWLTTAICIARFLVLILSFEIHRECCIRVPSEKKALWSGSSSLQQTKDYVVYECFAIRMTSIKQTNNPYKKLFLKKTSLAIIYLSPPQPHQRFHKHVFQISHAFSTKITISSSVP